MVLLLFIWLKLFIWPVPVAFGSGCVEGPIFLCGEGAVKVAKAIQYLEVEEAQQERGSGERTSARLAPKMMTQVRVFH